MSFYSLPYPFTNTTIVYPLTQSCMLFPSVTNLSAYLIIHPVVHFLTTKLSVDNSWESVFHPACHLSTYRFIRPMKRPNSSTYQSKYIGIQNPPCVTRQQSINVACNLYIPCPKLAHPPASSHPSATRPSCRSPNSWWWSVFSPAAQ